MPILLQKLIRETVGDLNETDFDSKSNETDLNSKSKEKLPKKSDEVFPLKIYQNFLTNSKDLKNFVENHFGKIGAAGISKLLSINWQGKPEFEKLVEILRTLWANDPAPILQTKNFTNVQTFEEILACPETHFCSIDSDSLVGSSNGFCCIKPGERKNCGI